MSAYTSQGCNWIEIENCRKDDGDGKKEGVEGGRGSGRGSGRERGYIGTRGIGKVGLSTREPSIMHGPRSRCGRQISSIEKEVQKGMEKGKKNFFLMKNGKKIKKK